MRGLLSVEFFNTVSVVSGVSAIYFIFKSYNSSDVDEKNKSIKIAGILAGVSIIPSSLVAIKHLGRIIKK